MNAFKHVCWLHCEFMINRYLMSNADGRQDGCEKASVHIALCTFYIAAITGSQIEDVLHDDLFEKVHDRTQKLTDHLDVQIGFPLTARPDYEVLAPKFFEKWHDLAMGVLK